MRAKTGLWLFCGLSLFACSGMSLNDGHYVLDPPNTNLRGKTPKDDLSEDHCNPVKQSDGSLKYMCVVFFYPDYDKLLNKIAKLEIDLNACQQQVQKLQ